MFLWCKNGGIASSDRRNDYDRLGLSGSHLDDQEPGKTSAGDNRCGYAERLRDCPPLGHLPTSGPQVAHTLPRRGPCRAQRRLLLRYQWTTCDTRTRLRFLAYSHRLDRTNGITFMILVLLWLRAHDVQTSAIFLTDWGHEFGGDSLARITSLATPYLHPLRSDLRRCPLGHKAYNGRVERSHRTDDEGFYRSYFLSVNDTIQFLHLALHWVDFFNTIRPHFGQGMDQKPPLELLGRLGYNGPAAIAALPLVLLDDASTELTLYFRTGGGNDVLATYPVGPTRCQRALAQSSTSWRV